MKIKAASGITQFQKYKEYDTWFNKLFNVMKSTASFQPSLQGHKLKFVNKFWKIRKNEKKEILCTCPWNNKKASKERKESLNSALESIPEYLNDHPAHELLSFLNEDSER